MVCDILSLTFECVLVIAVLFFHSPLEKLMHHFLYFFFIPSAEWDPCSGFAPGKLCEPNTTEGFFTFSCSTLLWGHWAV